MNQTVYGQARRFGDVQLFASQLDMKHYFRVIAMIKKLTKYTLPDYLPLRS